MKIAIAGGTGFIGKKITNYFKIQGDEVLILTRKNPQQNPNLIEWMNGHTELDKIEGTDVIINLAGTSINDRRWTKAHQQAIYKSRMEATDELLNIVAKLKKKPKVWINASAIGIYPSSETAQYTEESMETATDFLAKTVKDWEHKAQLAQAHNIRTVFCRFGVVLGTEGALPLMVLPYKLFAGGTVGTGKQWVSWVHVNDVVKAIHFAIQNDKIKGPVNVTAPSPVTMKEFGQTIGNVLNRPHWFPTPAPLLKLALGKKSQLVLEGQFVVPKVLTDAGMAFQYPTLKEALEDLLKAE